MATTTPLHGSDATRLQEVLTRYVDSRDGYRQAAKLVPQQGLAESFELISQRRDFQPLIYMDKKPSTFLLMFLYDLLIFDEIMSANWPNLAYKS